MSDHAPRTLVVKEVVKETGDAHSLVFEGPAMPYRPGQFLTLRIPSDREPTARCYSLSSSPDVDDLLKVTIKRTVDGYGSNWVCDNIEAGTTVEVLPPAGHFTPRDLGADLLLFAGGSGITPVMSIVKSALKRGRGRLVLVYANRDDSSVIFAAELAELSRRHPGRLVLLHWLESVQGLPSAEQLAELVRPHVDGREAFICGPGPFMDAVKVALAELGVPRPLVHVEKFVSLSGTTWGAPVEVVDDGGPSSTVHVELDGDATELSWPQQSKLLDLLLAKGLDAPYSCRQGDCSACACKLLEGEVTMINNNVLEKQDLDEGWILACQSLPVSDLVKVSYDA
ncbi:MAG: 3-ketosteroid-9-alpha-hydroxylase [Frankiales bacterium]|nr:3-ketosteroid-9-alpha-hydroxylase [Frankiales bacterium]